MSLSSICIAKPVMTTLLASALVVFGAFAFRLLPVSALPRVEFPTIVVFTRFPGASPAVMAASVALPLEQQFSQIAGIDEMVSVNSTGNSQVIMQFDLDRNIDAAALDVQAAITVALRTLPTQLPAPPGFRKVNPSEQPIINLSLSSATMPLSQVDEYAETIIGPRLSSLAGVAQVNINGQQKFAIMIRYNPYEMERHNVSVQDVENAVIAADSNVPAGTLSTSSQQFTIQSNDQMMSAKNYDDLVVAWRNGTAVRLRDVAKTFESVANEQTASWFSGTRAITLSVTRQPGSNTVDVAKSITDLIPVFRAQLPPSVKINLLVDRSTSIRDSVRDVEYTLAVTIALVVMVIFLFLKNLTATVIPAVVLPVSLIGTFALMYELGYSLDNLSLMALALAVGFVVDDAIVMLENIVRHIEGGERVMEAAIKGSSEIGFTIVSITISLLAAFIPVLFMGGVVGRLFHEFAVTIGIAISVSGLISLTLTPMMCSRLLRGSKSAVAHNHDGALFSRLTKLYGKGLDLALAYKPVMLLITFATLAATIYLFIVIPKGFFPLEDTGLLFCTVEASEDVSFDRMSAYQQEITKIALADPDVKLANATVGVVGGNPILNDSRMFLVLKDKPERQDSIFAVMERLRAKFRPVVGINVFMQPIQNLTIGARIAKSSYQYTISATNLGDLMHYTPLLEEKMRAIPVLQDVSSDLLLKSPLLNLQVDRVRAAAYGVSLDAVRNTLYSAFGQKVVTQIYSPSDTFQVMDEVAPEFQTDPNLLHNLYVRSINGSLVPMDSVATLVQQVGPTEVNHEGGLPAATVSFNLRPGASLSQATAAIAQVEHGLDLPATVSTQFRGTAQEFQRSLASQGVLIMAALMAVYIVLGVLYESYIHPLTILSGLPSASLGALLTLMIFHTELSIIAIIGLVMLIGIVKKNAIMMIDFAIERRHQGYSAYEAIHEACLLRFRPIMMTTMSALMGALPIAFGYGAGGELRQPLGLSVVGGLAVSQLLTLFITPVIYLYMEDLVRLVRGHSDEPAIVAAKKVPELAE
jgi:HAE1 family hydrophobic/amphiphilic exporter-1